MLATGGATELSARRFWNALWRHEPYIVGEYLTIHGPFPKNLVVRISADFIEDRPITPTFGQPTSTVHRHKGEPVPAASGLRKDSIECRAYLHENRCGPCRACFSPLVKSVSYLLKS